MNPDILLTGNRLYYSSGSVIVCYNIETGKQKFLLGHTDAVATMDVCENVLASAQVGEKAVIRVWINDKNVISYNGPATKIQQVRLSSNGALLAMVGLDGYNRQIIVVVSIKDVQTRKKIEFVAKQISDFHIQCLKFAPCDPNRLVSCGKENIRFWRIKNEHLPGNPVVLSKHARNVFTCLDFDSSPDDPKAILRLDVTRHVLVGSKLGLIFKVDFKTQELAEVYKVHEAGVSSMALSAGYCVTGSEDKMLRVWHIDFSEYLLEAEHEGAVTSLSISEDATNVVCATSNGGLGLLDLTSHSYKTMLRSHTGEILELRQQGATGLLFSLSKDLTIRVWDKDRR